MHLEPLTGVLGARATGIDLRRLAADGDAAAAADLRAAVCEHEVVVVPGQGLSPADQTAFSHLLGPYSPVPFVQPVEGHPEVIRVVKEAEESDAFNFGGVWHSDFSFLPAPPALTVLHAIDVPEVGGDTAWSSMTAAHDGLDDEMRGRLGELTAVHSASASYSPAQQSLHAQLSGMDIRTSEDALDVERHPLLCTHPETGRCSLFFNGTYVRGLEGPGLGPDDDPEGSAERRLLRWLHDWTTHVRFTCRHRWSNGDVVIWDNRSTQHVAINDYGGQRRELTRTTVAGTRPAA
ncbi:MAG: TauD/TfdA family dioxygenase [Acidimicrobiales bacterium]|jgi:taurine dioxygenase|nr:TauD/TfdA family dioxygenase [Acidimicrobiales bacterium]|tara:strand:- start:289 stop:1164 length:876 start_codon:yes stop_codon:yes gene_type:complete